jgi:hypothetical protein
MRERPYRDSAKGLKPCPMCHGTDIGWIDVSYSFRFQCLGCSYLGPQDHDRGIERARQLWDADR